jgi:ribose transport system substrate-binding protein
MDVMRWRGRPLAASLGLVGLSALALALAVAASGCGAVSGTSGNTKKSATKVDPNAAVHIAAFVAATGNTYFQAELQGIRAAATAAGGDVTVTAFDGKFDASVQSRQMQDSITTNKYNAFVVLPNDGAQAAAPAREAIAAGIKVIDAYSPIGPDPTKGSIQVPGVLATVWHDEPDDGTVLGQAAIDACEQQHPQAHPCKVALINGGNTVAAEVAKSNRFKAIIKGKDIQLVALQPGEFLRDKARAVAQNMLQAHPDIAVLATTGDQMTQGAEDAVKSVNKIGKISLLGDGTTKYAIDAVDAGRWFSTNVYLPFTEGKIATKILIDAVRGKQPAQTEVNVRDSSPVGKVYTKASTVRLKAEWSP